MHFVQRWHVLTTTVTGTRLPKPFPKVLTSESSHGPSNENALRPDSGMYEGASLEIFDGVLGAGRSATCSVAPLCDKESEGRQMLTVSLLGSRGTTRTTQGGDAGCQLENRFPKISATIPRWVLPPVTNNEVKDGVLRMCCDDESGIAVPPHSTCAEHPHHCMRIVALDFQVSTSLLQCQSHACNIHECIDGYAGSPW